VDPDKAYDIAYFLDKLRIVESLNVRHDAVASKMRQMRFTDWSTPPMLSPCTRVSNACGPPAWLAL
jgi:hypothetical protein